MSRGSRGSQEKLVVSFTTEIARNLLIFSLPLPPLLTHLTVRALLPILYWLPYLADI